jgi:hypothetical protein
MQLIQKMREIKSEQWILSILLLEFIILLVSGVSFSQLSHDPFFSINADVLVWAFFLADIPQLILAHQWIGILADLAIIVLLTSLIIKPGRQFLAGMLFFLLACFYVTMTAFLTHRNFQSGIFLAIIPFMFSIRSRAYAFEICRYMLLFFYFSSAILKLNSDSLWNVTHLSNYLVGQFAPYYVEGNNDWRTTVNLYLAGHPAVSHLLYFCSFIIEFITIIGFFTKRFDKAIGCLLILFHCANWIVMDIAPIGHLSFISLFYF